MSADPRMASTAVGAAVVVAIAATAWLFGGWVSVLGPAGLAILLGAALRTGGALRRLEPAVASKLGTRLLQVSIVVLGLSVDVVEVFLIARTGLPVMLGTLAIGLAGIWALGRGLGVGSPTRTLLAVGTSICGASAIASAGPVIGASAIEMSYAISVVFLFNVVAVIVFPIAGHALDLSSSAFAIWAGTAVNDTSSVLAAGYAFGAGTAAYAAVVKMSRTIMILPVTVGLAVVARRGHDAPVGYRVVARAVPWFVVAFLVAAVAKTSGVLPDELSAGAATTAQVLSVLALSAVGAATDVRAVRRAGLQPIALGLAGWLLVAVSSLALQGATGLL